MYIPVEYLAIILMRSFLRIFVDDLNFSFAKCTRTITAFFLTTILIRGKIQTKYEVNFETCSHSENYQLFHENQWEGCFYIKVHVKRRYIL